MVLDTMRNLKKDLTNNSNIERTRTNRRTNN